MSRSSVSARTAAAPAGPVLCLGEALVDLICEAPVASPAHAPGFVPRFGGATANVAVNAARLGARVAIAGGAGGDAWGEWLRDRLAAEGVDTRWFALVDGAPTAIALIALDAAGEPSYTIYGEGLAAVAHALEGRLEEAVASAGALFLGSNTLVGEAERAVTMRARELALERGLPLVIDANLRLHRWRSRAEAAAATNACVPGSLLVRLTDEEAAVLTAEDDPERAALALVKAGARLVVVTLGAEGAILRGELRGDARGVPARVRSTIGAGDALMGTLLARLALAGYYPPAIAAALDEAVASAARTCEQLAALD